MSNRGVKLAPRPLKVCSACGGPARTQSGTCGVCVLKRRWLAKQEARDRHLVDRFLRMSWAMRWVAEAISQEGWTRGAIARGEMLHRTKCGHWTSERGGAYLNNHCIKALAERRELVIVRNRRAVAWPT